MSRIGKKPIPLPSGVKITVGEQLEVKGPKGTLTVPIPEGITFEQADGKLEVKRSGDEHAAIHGLTRALTANAVQDDETSGPGSLTLVRFITRLYLNSSNWVARCMVAPLSQATMSPLRHL